MTKTAATTFFLLVLGLLLFDSVGFYAKSIKYLFIDSRFLLLLFVLISTLSVFFNRPFLPPLLVKLNKLFFPILFIATIGMVLGNYYWYPTFSLHLFHIDVRNFIFVTFLSGYTMYLSYANTLKLKKPIDKLQFLGPPLFLVTLIFLEYFFRDIYNFLEKEDSVFENLQFIGYLLSGLFSLRISLKLLIKKRRLQALLFLIFSLALLFIAGEEISWGQRIFHITTPQSIAEVNLQKEITVHNFRNIERKTYFLYMSMGLYGAFSWLGRKFLSRRFQKQVALFVPRPKLFLYFFAAFAFFFFSLYLSTYYDLFTATITSFDPWQELAELYLSLGLLQFTLGAYKQVA